MIPRTNGYKPPNTSNSAFTPFTPKVVSDKPTDRMQSETVGDGKITPLSKRKIELEEPETKCQKNVLSIEQIVNSQPQQHSVPSALDRNTLPPPHLMPQGRTLNQHTGN